MDPALAAVVDRIEKLCALDTQQAAREVMTTLQACEHALDQVQQRLPASAVGVQHIDGRVLKPTAACQAKIDGVRRECVRGIAAATAQLDGAVEALLGALEDAIDAVADELVEGAMDVVDETLDELVEELLDPAFDAFEALVDDALEQLTDSIAGGDEAGGQTASLADMVGAAAKPILGPTQGFAGMIGG